MRKEYFISSSLNENLYIVCKNAEGSPKTWEELNDPKLRFTYKIGDKILTTINTIETIKDINYNYGSLEKNHGYEWLITVEENDNQYKPIELIGIFVKYINKEQFNNL